MIVSNSLGAALTSSVATLSLLATLSVEIAQWDFNDTDNSVASPPPTIGTGTAPLVTDAPKFFRLLAN